MLHNSRWQHQYIRTLVTFIGWGIFSCGLAWVGVARLLVRAGEVVTRPLVQVVAQGEQTIISPFTQLGEGYGAARRVQELEVAFSQSLARITQLESLEKENQVLRDILGAQDKQVPTQIATPIISYGTPSISLGAAEGIEPGMPVIANGSLLGLVDTVSSHQSRVILLSELRQHSILARSESGVEGLVMGDGRRTIFTELPVDAVVEKGEKIITVGQPQIPSNILIGQVGQIVSSKSAPTQVITVEQLVDFYDVPIVEVMP